MAMKSDYLEKIGNTFVVGNFKGGVGKTKIVVMLGYDNAIIRKRKTLIVDIDPQANATQNIARTFNIDRIETTITDGVAAGDLSVCITPVHENLDLIACNTNFRSFLTLVTSIDDENEKVNVLRRLIDPLREKYDEIFIDVPPTISDFSDNAMAASDYSIIAFQTVEESLEGVHKYVKYQKFMIERYNIDLQVIEILPCMTESTDELDLEILEEAKEQYGTVVSENIIYFQKRLKRYSRNGISLRKYKNGNFDQWDYKAHAPFIDLLSEIDSRREFLQQNL